MDIRDFGAVGDGKSDCTEAIGLAIAACVAGGGGYVDVPDGEWVSGPIELQSHVNLHLSAGATVRFIGDPMRYLPCVFVRWEGVECWNLSPLIYARNCHNVGISGGGRLQGRGQEWRQSPARQRSAFAALHQMVLDGVAVERRRVGEANQALLPQFILLIGCDGVVLEGFGIDEGGPAQTLHLAYCNDVLVRGIRLECMSAPWNDGIKIDSCRNVVVEDCALHTQGDAISIESGLNDDGWRVARPSRNIHIRRNSVTAGQAAFLIGSATAGGVHDVLVEECSVDTSAAGLCLSAGAGGGGVVENIVVRGVRLGRIRGEAIRMELDGRMPAGSSARAPVFRRIQFLNVECEQAGTAVRIAGTSARHFRDIRLRDVSIVCGRGMQCETAVKMDLMNVSIVPSMGPALLMINSEEVLIDGLKHIPRQGVFLALRGRSTRHIRIRGETDRNVRPAVVLGTDVPHDALVHE